MAQPDTMVKGEQFEFSLPERLNLGSYFLDCNLELNRADKTAIYYRDRSYSFRDLWILTNKVGNVLKSLGVEPENRVLLILEDSPEWVAAWLATMKVGAVGTHAYTYLTPHDYAYLLNLVSPKVVVVDGVTLGRVREAAANTRRPPVFLVSGERLPELRRGELGLHEAIANARDSLDTEPTHKDDPAFWNFSGGTTGKPKGVPHMHRDGVVSYHSFNHVFRYTEQDVVLRVPKLFFHYSRDRGLLFPLRNGAAVVLFEEKTTATLMFELIRKYRPTVLINVPTMMRAMIQTPEKERADLSCLRHSMSSGEALSSQLYEEWMNTFGTEVVNRFGTAEAGLGILCNRPGAIRPGSSGTVAPLVQIKLVDEAGEEVPRGQPGVLRVHSDAAGRYYVRDHEKSQSTFLGGNWVNTGDLFVQDENDYFWYVGRVDDMIKVSGVWVSPLEVERALQECPSVRECAAMGVQDADGLTKLKAFVVLAAGSPRSVDTERELQGYCRQRLAPHKIPRMMEILDELPKTGQGKIDRRLLRERAR